MVASVTVIGAGPTGLMLASRLAKKKIPVTVIEKTDHVGGMADSFVYNWDGGTYTLDYGPHKFYTQIDGIYNTYRDILGAKNINEVKKSNAIRIKGKDFGFPVRITQLLTRMSPMVGAQVGLGVAATMCKSPFLRGPPKSFEEHFIRGFGDYGYRLLFHDYAKKVWGDPAGLSAELARKRVPVGSAVELLKTMLSTNKSVSADTFFYPKEKGFGALGRALERDVRSHGGIFLMERTPTSIHWKKEGSHKKVYAIDVRYKDQEATQMEVDHLVSTMPISMLPALFSPQAPKDVLAAAAKLHFRSLRIFYLFLDKRPSMTDNWRFYPEESYIFNRVSALESFSGQNAPQKKAVLMVEVTCGVDDAKAKMDDRVLLERITKDLISAQVLTSAEQIKHSISRRAANVYPVYDLQFRKNLDIVLDFLASYTNIISLGRSGLFNYNNTDHCLDMGNRAAEWLISGAKKAQWWELLDYFDSYAIVD